MIVLEAASVTVLLAVSSTVYVFWAANRGRDIQFQEFFLFGFLIAFTCFDILEIFFPFHKITTISSILKTVVFSGTIFYDTNNLLKKTHGLDNSWVSLSVLYMDIIILFLHLLELFGSGGE
ncbi:BI1-like protein [Nymphaea thermarum]|nr:BI1-like protein [Nymphaea thermarum]